MTARDRLVEALTELAEEINARAGEARGIDPLFELSCRVVTERPDAVELVLLRSSGGGEESAYMIEDRARVDLGADGPTRLLIAPGEDEERAIVGDALRALGLDGLLARVRALCEARLPQGLRPT
jgi:hypothetical protein